MTYLYTNKDGTHISVEIPKILNKRGNEAITYGSTKILRTYLIAILIP